MRHADFRIFLSAYEKGSRVSCPSILTTRQQDTKTTRLRDRQTTRQQDHGTTDHGTTGPQDQEDGGQRSDITGQERPCGRGSSKLGARSSKLGLCVAIGSIAATCSLLFPLRPSRFAFPWARILQSFAVC